MDTGAEEATCRARTGATPTVVALDPGGQMSRYENTQGQTGRMCKDTPEVHRVGDADQPTIGARNARLTAKGLTKLQRMPDGVKAEAKSLIEQLSDATSSIGQGVSSVATAESVKRILGMIFGA